MAQENSSSDTVSNIDSPLKKDPEHPDYLRKIQEILDENSIENAFIVIKDSNNNNPFFYAKGHMFESVQMAISIIRKIRQKLVDSISI